MTLGAWHAESVDGAPDPRARRRSSLAEHDTSGATARAAPMLQGRAYLSSPTAAREFNSLCPTPVVTRFAPSPTGFLHIGGGRTALFNWLYAQAKGGKMLLRIEDTDRERSTEAAIAAILDGLSWLGLDWDGEPIYQFARAARHREVAETMLAERPRLSLLRHARRSSRRCARRRAREGRPPRYDGRWRDRDPATAPPGAKPVIRLRAPAEGETVIEDEVQGTVRWANKDLDDLVLLRSDGTPTYMLAVVVDDHDMGVTHIIRGDDHLTNAARQKQIYDAMGWDSAEHGAYPADPWVRTAPSSRSATVRWASMPIARSATCRRRCATTSCGCPGAMATRRYSRRRR